MTDPTSYALALAEGFGLAFSPCILPILPLVLAGATTGRPWRPLQIIAGFIVSFTLFVLSARAIFAVLGVPQDDLQRGAFALLLALGLVMVIPALERRFSSLTATIAGKAQDAGNSRFADGPFGGLMIGALIGLVWTPCAGPLLAAVLVQIIQSGSDLSAALTILSFSIGVSVPMLAVAYLGRSLTHWIGYLARHAHVVRRAMGGVLIVFAALGLFGINIGAGIAPSAAAAPEPAPRLINALDTPYPAPPFAGTKAWLNSPPLAMQQLRGKVVLIDFWTYSCINCIRTLPYLKDWHAKYAKDGLVIIGVHAPEFAFEGDKANVEKAIAKFGIGYPVAMDNALATWSNYRNRYWPAHYLIDRQGRVVYTHFGEGEYEVTEHNIRTLLGQRGAQNGPQTGPMSTMAQPLEFSPGQTPETYLGYSRAERETRGTNLPLHSWSLSGRWARQDEYLEAAAAGATLSLHFNARKVFLVMASRDGKPKTVTVVQGAGSHSVTVQESRLYDIAAFSKLTEGTLQLRAEQAGVRMYAFTFGG